ncbi:MAG TPA: CDP-alcohol phosphatidyltransferase family protein [Candidatus Acidoferrales bacterium]|nr:CDP-alcohol phosphatidyltransferase family protein [Candidatus Acidoferrales bacterium]
MKITPNQITTLRVGMAFAAVGLLGGSPWSNFAALGLTAGASALDALDGYVARRCGLATPLGAQLDILGDRVIENLFFTYFAVRGEISLWVPIVFFVRGTLTDFIRGLAARAGRSAFGRNSMLESWWGRALVASRASRAAYGVLKCACFCYLGVELTLPHQGIAGWLPLLGDSASLLHIGSQVIVSATVTFCLLRGLPVIWEGRRYLDVLSRAHSRPSRVPALRGAAGGTG